MNRAGLDVKGLAAHWDDLHVLDDLSFKVEPGQFTAIVGPSGCGKTTLLRMIGGFESVDSGSIFLGDDDITHLPANE
ncbi:MAG: ATP-binding cassette domain-containing protein, partial [Actinomycetes bacterium]